MSIEKRRVESDNDEGQPQNKKVQKETAEAKQEANAETETQGAVGQTMHGPETRSNRTGNRKL